MTAAAATIAMIVLAPSSFDALPLPAVPARTDFEIDSFDTGAAEATTGAANIAVAADAAKMVFKNFITVSCSRDRMSDDLSDMPDAFVQINQLKPKKAAFIRWAAQFILTCRNIAKKFDPMVAHIEADMSVLPVELSKTHPILRITPKDW